MNYKQNERIMQISEKTLVVGVDIAKDTHYARAFDYRGIELGKIFSFASNEEGMKSFSSWVKKVMERNKKDSAIVGMEPTGHYWFTFAQYIKDNSMKTVLVNPFHVKRSKELDDNSQTKNDRKDPKTIAMLMKDGRFMEPYIPEGVYSEVRVAVDTRDLIIKELSQLKNRIQRWLNIYFPEYGTVFGDWEGKASIITLKNFATPEKVLATGVQMIAVTWKKDISRGIGVKRAIRLHEAAKSSIGIREGLRMAEFQLKSMLETYEVLMKQLQELESSLEELLNEILGTNEILKIKGIGLVTLSVFIAEVGDISRFETPKQIQKLAGLSLKENSSGKHKGKTTISKRGRRRLRRGLFQAIRPLVAKNKEFKELHKYYTTRTLNPLKKMQSMILLCCKLIRIFFVLLTKKVEYNVVKMMSDIHRPEVA